jgi:hypothetical protein
MLLKENFQLVRATTSIPKRVIIFFQINFIVKYIHIYKGSFYSFNVDQCGEQYEEFCFLGNHDIFHTMFVFELNFYNFQKNK